MLFHYIHASKTILLHVKSRKGEEMGLKKIAFEFFNWQCALLVLTTVLQLCIHMVSYSNFW